MGGTQYERPERIAALDDLYADNLHAARKRLGISRRELAQRTGIPFPSIEKIETGHGCPPGRRRRVAIGEAVVLAEALGLKPGDLLKRGLAVRDA
jgi:transcriptional regulator with XRE-family HTH domain